MVVLDHLGAFDTKGSIARSLFEEARPSLELEKSLFDDIFADLLDILFLDA